MSDIIFSNKKIKKNILTKHLEETYPTDEILEFHGKWGSLGIITNNLDTNYYFSNDTYIMVGLGNPNALHDLKSKISLALFNKKTDWSKTINGPFIVLVINKKTNDVNILTDLMSFIPLYKYSDHKNIFISSHTDLLAEITNQTNNRDEVSELDFILNGSVTYPYTSYSKIKQLAPGTEFNLKKDNTYSKYKYWAPYEINTNLDINDSASKLRSILEKDIGQSIKKNDNIAHFLSGGEDSRVISGLLKDKPKDSYTFLDIYNREGKIANKIAKIYNSNLTIKYRDQSYYLDILKQCSKLVGSNIEYKHGHAFKFVEECNLNEYDYVIGGLFSDLFLKGSRINKNKIRQKLSFLPQKKSNKNTIELQSADWVNRKTINELNKRREKHLSFIKNYRNNSAYEWFNFYPASMNDNVGNYHVNRRLFNSYEPFLSNEIVKFSSATPQNYKLNRKLFNLAFNSILKESKFVMHGNGFFPYFPWYINSSIQFPIKSVRKIYRFFFNTNQGPWADWDQLMKSKKWDETVESITENNIASYPYIKKNIREVLLGNQIDVHKKVNLMQLVYLKNN